MKEGEGTRQGGNKAKEGLMGRGGEKDEEREREC